MNQEYAASSPASRRVSAESSSERRSILHLARAPQESPSECAQARKRTQEYRTLSAWIGDGSYSGGERGWLTLCGERGG